MVVTNPLLKYIDQRVAIHTPTKESSKIVHDWIIELGGKSVKIGYYAEIHCHGMAGISQKANTFGTKGCYFNSSRYTIIHFDDLLLSDIIEVW